MVKLIRLASDNNGIFKSNFQNDIIIEPKSKIALLNTTFTNDFDILSVSQYNNKVIVVTDTTDPNDTLSQALLDIVDYGNTPDASKKLEANIKRTLNTALLGQDTPLANNIGSQFNIRNDGERKRLEYRYAPFLNPLNLPGDSSGRDEVLDYDEDIIDVTTTANVTTIKKIGGKPATLDRSDTIISGNARLSNGNGVMTCRIKMANAAGALQNQGFGIGLTNSNLPETGLVSGENIPDRQVGWEIRYSRRTETYKFTLKPTVNEETGDVTILEQDSNILPNKVFGAPADEHDFILFEMKGGELSGSVCQIINLGNLNLPTGNPWTQSPGGAVERFDITNLGTGFADFRRTQDGSTLEHWWKAKSATDWDIYFTGPPTSTDTPDTTATADLTSGVISITGTAITFNPGNLVYIEEADYLRKEIFRETLGINEQDLYPYIYLNGPSTSIELEMFNLTLDPWINQNYDNDTSSDVPPWKITGLNYLTNPSGAGVNGFAQIKLDWEDNATGDNLWGIPDGFTRWQKSVIYSVTMHRDIWEFLGFRNLNAGPDGYAILTNLIGIDEFNNCWSFETATLPFNTTLTDSFIVESRSLALDSYDASQVSYTGLKLSSYTNTESDKQGRRKNILMTIPVNDNETGLVEYDANTPIFIDINNSNILNQKTLNFEILDKNFNNIRTTADSSIMTILIKGPDE